MHDKVRIPVSSFGKSIEDQKALLVLENRAELFSQKEQWKKVCSIDLKEIEKRMTIKKGWTQKRVRSAIKRYRYFLFMCSVLQKSGLQPTSDVDEIWHDHILHMKKYEEDCKFICGKTIYHKPSPVDLLNPVIANICQNESGDLIDPPEW